MIDKINGFCKKLQFLSGAQLKLIAIVSMLVDHINKALIYPNLTSAEGFSIRSYFLAKLDLSDR